MNNYIEFNSFWLFGIVSSVFLLLLNWYRRPLNFPPGPRGIPVLGYLPFITKRIECDVMKLREKYGPIISIRMGSNDVVFLNDYKSIRTALVKNGAISSGRPRFPIMESVVKGKGIIFSDYHESWKTQRKFGLTTLKEFDVGRQGMEKIVVEELFYLNAEIQKYIEKPFDISIIIHNAISNIISRITLGKRFDYKDREFVKQLNELIHRFDDPLQSISDRLITLNPTLKYVPPFCFIYKKTVKWTKNVFSWVEKYIEEHEKTFDENNIRDFIDAFIKEKRKGKDSSFTNFQLVNYIHELFVAGTETTSSTLYWALLCLIHYPDTQKKLKQEIRNVIGLSGSISMSNKSEMPFTCAFIQEVMRFRTLVPLALPHKANADFYIDEYLIPKETQLMPNIWAVHNDPNIWKEPEIFNPERFLDNKETFIKSNHVIPFSVGPRHCLGEQLAKMEVFIFLVGMVQKFEFLPDSSAFELPNIDDGPPGFIFTPTKYKLVVAEN